MSVQMINVREVRNMLDFAVKNKQKSDIAFAYMRSIDNICYMNKEELRPQMITWKKQRKEGILTIDERNNKTREIAGKTFHILVLQQVKNGEIDSIGVDMMGLGFGFAVDGLVYVFKSIENRDATYKYVMGIK